MNEDHTKQKIENTPLKKRMVCLVVACVTVCVRLCVFHEGFCDLMCDRASHSNAP